MAEVRAFFPDLIGVDQMKRRNALLESGDARANAQLGLDYRRQQVAENALMQRQNEGMDTARREAIGQLGAMAQAAQRSGNPRAFVMSVVRNPQYRPIFQAAGVDPAQLDLNSPTFDDDLGTWAALGPQVSPDARFNRETAEQGRQSTQEFQSAQGKIAHARRMEEIRAQRQPTATQPAAPAGYRWKADGTMEAIPGGPADAKLNPPKKLSDAKDVLEIIRIAEPLIDKATNSYVGAGVDQAARVFGKATDGGLAISQLKALQAALMLKMPRMEGPQSDRDVQLYREAAGEIGDPTVPAENKRAALEVIKAINQKYTSGGASGGASGSWSVEEVL